MVISKWRFFLVGIFAAFSSCQVVRYVGINNYQEPRHIIVGFANSDQVLWDSDTLNTGLIGVDTFANVIIRRKLTSTSYTFTAPDSTHIELMPKGLVNPFTWIKIVNGPDTLVINLLNKSQLKQLKKEGIIETSGLPESMFLINIGKQK